MEVLNYAALGKSNKQIAKIIGLSESTIKNHFSSTLRKLHANDRTHAVTLALCNGWLSVKNISNILEDEETVLRATSGY
jgi:two-component system NarL family response regulator